MSSMALHPVLVEIRVPAGKQIANVRLSSRASLCTCRRAGCSLFQILLPMKPASSSWPFNQVISLGTTVFRAILPPVAAMPSTGIRASMDSMALA